MKIYYEIDADLSLLKNKTIGIIGYGSQGHAQAQNIKDSGLNVLVAQRPGGPNYELAKKHGFSPMSVAEVAEKSDIIQILLPDEIQKDIYEKDILPHLKPGKALVFSHGFNIHFELISPPKNIDVYMVAPKAPGHTVRREYVNGTGVPSLIAIYNNSSNQAKELALAHSKAIGSTKVGVFETSFKEETETDLFGEQTVLCGGLAHLILAAFETLVEAGYAKEMAYFECLHEMKLIVDLFYEGGLADMFYSISDTAEYGAYATGSNLITSKTKQEMKKVLKNIQNGSFAAKFIQEAKSGKVRMKAERNILKNHDIEKVGKDLRKMMQGLFKNKLIK